MTNNEYLISDKKVLSSLDRLFYGCTEIDSSGYNMLKDIIVIKEYINQRESIIKNALEILNYDKNPSKKITESYLYYFDKCADFKGDEKQ